jgi:lysophospholipase L1-like esterase
MHDHLNQTTSREIGPDADRLTRGKRIMNRRSLLCGTIAVGLLAGVVTDGAEADAATKRIMVYGDSNTWGFIPIKEGAPSTRYPSDERWPNVMRASLGDNYEVVDEALNGRTTDIADPTNPQVGGAGLDGSAYLPAAIASHLPLDLVVIMLGTNDLKNMFHRSPLRIALGVGNLVDLVASSNGGVGTKYPAPKVLVLCPPPLGNLAPQAFEDMFSSGVEKSKQLPAYYEAVATAAGAEFLDLGKLTPTDGMDGVHLTAAAQKKIGENVAERVKKILP